MAGWRCFMAEPSEFCRRALRRYWRKPDAAPPGHFHDATVVIDEQFHAPGAFRGRGTLGDGYEGDPRWPKACSCGYAFLDADHRQMNEERLYRGAPDGKLYVMRDLPPGAIWRATWMEDISPNPYAGPDGRVWAMMMPSGDEWLIYGPATGGGKWTVTGELPKITVHPSIHQIGSYHGFVRDGIVTPDCEGRVFGRWPQTA